jgi:phenylpropionate dioxygenase-like ring-hydroxylating dioxygenase large terminal subunit
MGMLKRRYWTPVTFSSEVTVRDGPPIRVRLFGEDLVLFRDTSGSLGLIADQCPHRLASMFFGRNGDNGLRCVYHGSKFDVTGACTDLPCVPPVAPQVMESMQKSLRTNAYRSIERAGLVWTYMGPGEAPAFPDFEWTLLPENYRYTSRHIQKCNWLQALEGGFDAPHLTFLHAGENPDSTRGIVPSFYEVAACDFGFIVSTGRDFGKETISWNLNVRLMPFHKIIATTPHAAHMWVPINDANTMLYSIDFQPKRPLNETEISRAASGDWVHSENLPNSDIGVRNKRNDYLIDRILQASGKSFTGLKGFGTQDCAIEGSMGTLVDRSREHLPPGDEAIIKPRQLLLQALEITKRASRYRAAIRKAIGYALFTTSCRVTPIWLS